MLYSLLLFFLICNDLPKMNKTRLCIQAKNSEQCCLEFLSCFWILQEIEDHTYKCDKWCLNVFLQCFAFIVTLACQIKQLTYSREADLVGGKKEHRADITVKVHGLRWNKEFTVAWRNLLTAYGIRFQMGGISSALLRCLGQRCLLILHLGCFAKKTGLDQRYLCCHAGCLGFTLITAWSM